MINFRLLIIIFTFHLSFGQVHKVINATRTLYPPKIDGIINDSCWLTAAAADGFIQRDLHPGLPTEQKTEVKILYDDDAIYVSAFMHEVSADSVLHELSTRDNEANADLFGVFFDTYNDDINAFGFFLTAAGTQIDARYSSEGQDFNWNAVWTSAVKITEKGWNVEMKIPYSALRFSAKSEQVWGINFIRKNRRLRENSFWNPLDPIINALVRQFGDLTGLQNIKPPVRLSISPYVAGILNHYPHNIPGIKNTTYNVSGGLDLKYGVTDGFTLDMTLVPDFSQVQSDNQVLNLSPFEVQFQERRPFFTEGTELFNKGGLFYSRRVGGTPIDYYSLESKLNDGEKIIKNPSQTKLLNATKLSGRTSGKLGIGIFNAISDDTYATAQDSIGQTREILTDPLTNYNIMVFDQALKNNSYVTLVNTNVTRNGNYHDANVTGVSYDINNKKNTYGTYAFGAMSQRFFADSAQPVRGYSANMNFGKRGGNFRWTSFLSINTDSYNPNDLGIQFITNNIDAGVELSYNIYKPFWKLNNLYNDIGIFYQRIYKPNVFANFGIGGGSVTTFSKRFITTGIRYGFEPIITYDYYEPRIFGRYYTFPTNYRIGGFISTDYRKKLAFDLNSNMRIFHENQRREIDFSFSPRLRVNNKLSFNLNIYFLTKRDDIGFVNYNSKSDSITFGRRNLQTVSNTLSSIYKFSNKMSLSIRIRHYWSNADYKSYYNLEQNGTLSGYNYAGTHNVNFNAFNVDLVYFWQFAPGSELNLVWKNAVLKRESELNDDYYYNLRGSLNSPQFNTISVKVLYYLDYITVSKSLRSKKLT